MAILTKQRLQELMDERGYSAFKLSIEIGKGKDFIRDFLQGRKDSLKQDDLENIAKALNISTLDSIGVPPMPELPVQGLVVEGVAQAGTFRDISLEDDCGEKPMINIARDTRFPQAHQYALLIVGDSMDRLYPDGCYVTCADWGDTGLELQNKMPLHVDRIIAGKLVETTIKLYMDDENGRRLSPHSHNPKHQDIPLEGGEDTEIMVKGVILGHFVPGFIKI